MQRRMFINPRKFDLRWRFDFSDGRPSKFGQWNRPGEGKESVQLVNTKNLVRASIEGKDVLTREIKTIAECDGHHYCLIKYIAATRVGLGAKNLQGNFPTKTDIIGLVLVTTDIECEVHADGSRPNVRKRTEEEKKMNYIAYGR